MSIFRSQYDRARSYTEEYAGDARDSAWRSPTVIAAAVGGGAAVVAAAVPVVAGDEAAAGEQAPAGEPVAAGEQGAGDGGAWGEGWEAGWDAPAGGADGAPAADDGSGSWMERGGYTDAGVGGDEDFFYFIDGDSSMSVD